MQETERSESERTVRLASIVAVDVVGFSTMSERDQRKAAAHVERLRARINAVAESHGGRLFNTAGDGFMLEFSSAGAALGAVQDLLDKRPKGEPPIRVGAHVGDVVVTITNDLLGHGVNVAARLQALAAPGSALVSSEFRSMARNSPSAAFQPRGRQPLENIEQKVQTFEILSQRQRTARLMRRVGIGLGAAAVIGAIAFATPYAIQLVRQYLPPAPTAEAVAPTEAGPSPQPLAAPVATPTAAPAAETPSVQVGQIYRDCAACPDMVVLAGGLYRMGSPASEVGRGEDEGPQREVAIAPFALARTEITFAQWDACVAGGGCNASAGDDRRWGRDAQPAIGLAWTDAQAYVTWLNAQVEAGPRYRLPSEAEWEFGARAGAATAFAFGDALTSAQGVLRARRTSAVASVTANALGLSDMHGNAAEWVQDCYAPSYDLAPIDGTAIDGASCPNRVLRGGLFSDLPARARSAARAKATPDTRGLGYGFRVARSVR